ncbi:MAG: peptide chain release factor N(5)-glutamine methyltransferase [Candidatus Magasanikbacteria bacterium]|nr:peptide chain release factor N(5)-glutamine methyltransferase [Candidatus Magasanikbacteria bacterium]
MLRRSIKFWLRGADTDLLLAHVIQKPREFLYAHHEYKLSLWQYFRWRFYSWQRHRGVPLAYITRHKEFFGLNFFVNKHVLIPRPETELTVEMVLQSFATTPHSLQPTLLVDVGTGSGCIPIAIAKHTPLTIFATDISRRALRVAAKNARAHNVGINFLQGNLLEPVLKHNNNIFLNKNIIITANLPYLTSKQFAEEKSIQHEPRLALVSGATGLELYEQLLKQIQNIIIDLKPKIFIFLEIDPSQSSALTALIKKYLPTAQTEIKTDLAGRDRVVVIQL